MASYVTTMEVAVPGQFVVHDNFSPIMRRKSLRSFLEHKKLRWLEA